MHEHLNMGSEFPLDKYMEFDSERWQLKVVGFFSDGRVVYAYDDIECGAFLAEDVYPEPEDVNGVDGYEGIILEYISKEEFYEIWDIYVNEK